ncbi:MAG: ribosome biogenesis/translation initiation ATPase RLI [Candidatus Woesearchaeota archaeon]
MPRIAVIEKEKCNPHACGNYLCIRLCPVNREGKDCIVVGEDKKALIYEGLCTGCGICVNRCPFDAIKIINIPDELAKKPLHQFGINSFRMYNMPVPNKNNIVGIMGRNGMGKTTLMNILSGSTIPNLGDYEQEPSWDKVHSHFKGTKAQNLFLELSKNSIKASLKPQMVERIPEHYDGSVIGLLSRVDDNNRLTELKEKLNIGHLMDRDIKQISGGELQRVAICASILRESNLLLVDEPSSYLDIKQRIISAQTLSEEKNNKDVMVVEHDLLILDYLADIIHINFGTPKAYAISSLPRPGKNGINSYLNGYLREENIRFRQSNISFKTVRDKSIVTSSVLVEWPDMRKDYEGFSLIAGKGSLRSREIVGIVGENGTGKSTFVKMLSEKMGDNNEQSVKVSYKPQYLPSTKGTVSDFIREAFANHKRSLIQPLELAELESREMSTLSGGELQRVWIAHCLSQEASLYLLDEPSAYLDVEQRLAASRAIRTFIDETEKSAFIVDHDLLFIDVVSDSVMVFTGDPGKQGNTMGPYPMREGLNIFLKSLGITIRREEETGRPRINSPNSVLDRQQKESGNYYA